MGTEITFLIGDKKIKCVWCNTCNKLTQNGCNLCNKKRKRE